MDGNTGKWFKMIYTTEHPVICMDLNNVVYCKDCGYHPISFLALIKCPKCGSCNLGSGFKDRDGLVYPNI